MRLELRLLGIQLGMAGTRLLERMMSREITASDLTKTEIQQVLEAWETRNYVPAGMRYVDTVKSAITKEDVLLKNHTQEEYDRNYVEMIEKYLHTL